MGYRIAVLFHESDRARYVRRYAVAAFADIWRRDGHTVTFLFGTRKFVPADLILVHIDLSVVPEEYVAFSQKYPIVLNGKVRDIRKSAFSPGLLQSGDPYGGPVFVKSDCNFAGVPEACRREELFFPFSRACYYLIRGLKILRHAVNRESFRNSADYLVLENLQQVPRRWFSRSDIVIQRFFPEMEEGLYHTRFYVFLGDSWYCERLSSRVPVVNSSSALRTEYIGVHPDIERLRRELHFDFGKFDYVIHDGKPVLLDINKTIGIPRQISRELKLAREHCAKGLYSYFR